MTICHSYSLWQRTVELLKKIKAPIDVSVGDGRPVKATVQWRLQAELFHWRWRMKWSN